MPAKKSIPAKSTLTQPPWPDGTIAPKQLATKPSDLILSRVKNPEERVHAIMRPQNTGRAALFMFMSRRLLEEVLL